MSAPVSRSLLVPVVSLFILCACDVAPQGAPAPPPAQVSTTKQSLKDDCEHDMCQEGTPLTSTCAKVACLKTICLRDPYCCTHWWDDICVGHVYDFCPTWTCNVLKSSGH